MAKIQFSDVVPPERRSIRDIPIPQGGRRKKPIIITPEKVAVSKKVESVISELTNKKESTNGYEYFNPTVSTGKENEEVLRENKPPRKRQLLFGAIIFVLILGFIVSMMTVFASATILITPKNQEIQVSTKITATNEVDENPNTVAYEVIKISNQRTVNVEANGEEMAEVRASGKIMIYNNFSSEPQRLIVRTRFESPEGLIYRIGESVVVPGKKTVAGVATPGSIEVEVFADEAGEKYNIKKTDFTIPGFKSDPNRYKNFYARSVTDMTNGFIGKRKTVLASEKQTALENIDTELKAELEKELRSKIPEGLLLLSGGILYESAPLPQKEDSSSVIIGKETTAYAIMLKKADLSKRLVTEYVSPLQEWRDIPSSIEDFSSLEITNEPSDFSSSSKIELELSGSARALANVDTTLVSERLAGTSRKETPKLLDEFASISSIKATIRPIWKMSFPSNSAKIHVETVGFE